MIDAGRQGQGAVARKLPGGLAVVSFVTCAFFTAFTGASGVTIVAVGALLLPALVEGGYKERFSLKSIQLAHKDRLLATSPNENKLIGKVFLHPQLRMKDRILYLPYRYLVTKKGGANGTLPKLISPKA